MSATASAPPGPDVIEAHVAAARGIPDAFVVPPLKNEREPDNAGPLDVADLTSSLRSLMVRNMGIVRDRGGLLEAERAVSFWCRYVLAHEFDAPPGWELQNLLVLARLMIDAALRRDESRGTHFRSDFPTRDDARWGLRHNTAPKSEEIF